MARVSGGCCGPQPRRLRAVSTHLCSAPAAFDFGSSSAAGASEGGLSEGGLTKEQEQLQYDEFLFELQGWVRPCPPR